MVRIAHCTRLNQDIGIGTQTLLDQAMVHGTRGKGRMNNGLPLGLHTIAQMDHHTTIAHRLFNLVTQFNNRQLQSLALGRSRDQTSGQSAF